MNAPLPRHEFAATQAYVYLNHAAVGILPQSSRSAIDALLRAHCEAGVLGTFPYDARMPEFRERIGRFIGAKGGEIATIPSTSAGANVVALGLDLQAGDEVLLCDNEFPANAIPWLALRRGGVRVRLLATGVERLTPERLAREISPRTRAVALSWVSYADGYRHDLAALSEIAHAAGALLCVDGIQGLGALQLDVGASGIDTLYAGAGKWLLGVHGIGVLYVREALIERLTLAMPGWRSMHDMWDFHAYDQPYVSEAMRFEGGTPNIIGALSLERSIALFERSDPAAIERHILALTDYLYERLVRAGACVLSARGRGVSSGIVTFSMPGIDSVALGRTLQKEGIVTTYRPIGVRVAPHGYNTLEDVDRLIDVACTATAGSIGS
ncbi:MAG: aminotransferase class V-fold PLP-dependent enzyme [Candidatus Eremiobacteraeota bacterium]|nr:aminotransferase class V-fold PLP-dependent enzyme [Candidatus Eremiobacteraeota bacterium]